MTASLAKGMYERQYQVMARNCRTTIRMVRAFFCSTKAEIRVRTRNSSIAVEAIHRSLLNMLLIWKDAIA